jgi:hypothetical protein
MGLGGTRAGVAGNELSMRLGRQRLVRLAMTSVGVCPPAPDRPGGDRILGCWPPTGVACGRRHGLAGLAARPLARRAYAQLCCSIA